MNQPTPEVVCIGEILVDMIAQPHGAALHDAEAFVPKPGGAPAIVAVGLARLGAASAFVGMVGNDAFGVMLRDCLRDEMVDVRSLVISEEQPTTPDA